MFKLYASSWCDYCQKAKELLESEQQPFAYLDIDELENASDMRKEIKALTKNDPTTIPQITYLGVYVGGYNELVSFIEENLKSSESTTETLLEDDSEEPLDTSEE